MEVFKDIMNCLFAIGPFVTIAGVLFLHDVKKDRMTAGELRTLRWLQCFCGPEFYQNITIVTTKWDELKPTALRKARDRLEELKSDELAPLLTPTFHYQGAYLYNHGIPGGGVAETWDEALDFDSQMSDRAAEVESLSTYDTAKHLR